MKYRKHDWFDSKRRVPMFGIDGRFQGESWKHLAEDGKPLIYESESERDLKLKALRKSIREKQQ